MLNLCASSGFRKLITVRLKRQAGITAFRFEFIKHYGAVGRLKKSRVILLSLEQVAVSSCLRFLPTSQIGRLRSDQCTYSTLSKVPLMDSQGKQCGPALPYYAISAENVVANFSEWTRVKIHQGDIFDTLSKAKIERVSFLHIDMNWPEPEIYGLRTLWGRISRGGVVLLDDYAYEGYEPQYKAMNDLSREIGFDILTTATGQGIIIK